jgi:hypothetical protein
MLMAARTLCSHAPPVSLSAAAAAVLGSCEAPS